ncbi:transcription factor bHLH149-like protein [Cucumis melo var. makuwa]|uniref:Transcription factor bHLH149-like protein n=1 Tax=Cucumis melo var. makuwa TaxID=1194695 RepID=A0A5A7TYM9_CUCMM|nr:transcription factor bHLH149-like protein [Cucumis melo var. makuwa]TYJ96458.1 transcription factor bHLH149-like protein [Cucumis melo var. makuwa]
MDADQSNNSTTLLPHPANKRPPKIITDEPTQHTWKTEIQQQIYSSRLAEALRRVTHPRSSSTINGNLVRQTADSVLAATAKGRSRWSRAILATRFRQSLARRRRRTKKLLARKPELKNEKARKLPAVQRKVKILGRLVPGCRKLSFPNLLEEATDYISALEMQVKAMTALAELLAGNQRNIAGISNDS